MSVVKPLELSHVSLHFDGIRLSNNLGCSTDDFCQKCCTEIQRATGFLVKIREKVHRTLLEMVIHMSTQRSSLANVDECLMLDGNCIPCALNHLVSVPPAKLAEIRDPKSQSSAAAASRRARSYSATAAGWKVELEPLLGLHIEKPGMYLIHAEHLGSPHCVSVKSDGDVCTITDGANQYMLKTSDLMACADVAIDRLTIVTFIVSTGPIPAPAAIHGPADVRHLLLELQAGARRSRASIKLDEDLVTDLIGEEEGEDDGQSPFQPEAADNDAVIVVGDQLLHMMSAEVAKAVRLLSNQCRTTGQTAACNFCPFRSFRSKDRLLNHLRSHHTVRHQYVCSGTKQVKVIAALWDNDCTVGGKVGTDYIARIVAQ
jgi:hypothetical protein